MRPFVLLVAMLGASALARAQTAVNPHGAITETCSTCHRSDAWKPARVSSSFKHAERTFPLDGAHLRTTCTACHKSLSFAKTPTGCASCHSDIHSGELGTECARCHTTRSFADVANMRRAHETTRFPLRGAHVTASCESCHVPGQPGKIQFAGQLATCIGCHATNFRQAKSPDHVAARFSQDCASCHTVNSWPGARFDHATTRFALSGAHRTVACSSCHADKVFTGKSMACADCHQAAYASARNPPHTGFPTTCADCHTTTQWKGAAFNHAATQFPLTGAHGAVPCTSCHADGVYRGKPTTCVSCHQQNYASSVRPPHQSLGFPTTCATCHTTTQWPGAIYDHSVTQFPLTGAHRAATCVNCHATGVYRGTATTCLSCHQAKYAATTNPPHASAGFPTDCSSCHSTTAWTGAVFDHTRFPLTGAHGAVPCTACHADGVYRGKPTTCVSCHQQNYSATTRPPHSQLGFSTVCSACHTTVGWSGGAYDHSTTPFPLTGAHRAVSCAGCHSDGVYRGKPMLCVSCHQATYAATTSPAHAAAGFPTTCESCHTTTMWRGAVFNHATTRFPLTGAHVTQACASCHGDGVYRGKTMVCSGCHLPKYNSTTNPNHAAAQFPTTCESCHTTATWLGATFNHDAMFFPIYSGAHQGKWSSCTTCHTAPNNFAVFTCTSCHGKTETDSKHQGRAGYVYQSSNCYACHPQGRAGE